MKLLITTKKTMMMYYVNQQGDEFMDSLKTSRGREKVVPRG